MFSLRAPTQPVKPMTKVMAPVQMKMVAGSSVMLVSKERLLMVFFSVQAHTPMARMLKPKSWRETRVCNVALVRHHHATPPVYYSLTQNMTLNPKMTYLRQQETSLWSLLFRLWWCGPLERWWWCWCW